MLKQATIDDINILIERYPQLSYLYQPLAASIRMMCDAYYRGAKIMVCGNGGSAADSLHIVGELMKSFSKTRKLPENIADKITLSFPQDAEFYVKNLQGAIPAVSLVNEVSLITAFSNDKTSELAFAQQVLGHGREGDALLAISTSGNSVNILHAAKIAKCLGVNVIGLTGKTGGKLAAYTDVLLNAPATITHHIQEFHLPIYHTLCLAMETEIFS